MQYFQITAKCEEVDESSYTNQSTGEVVTKIQLSLVVPSMRERVLCELPLELPTVYETPAKRRAPVASSQAMLSGSMRRSRR